MTSDLRAVFQGVQDAGGDGAEDFIDFGFGVEGVGFGEGLVGRAAFRHADEGDGTTGALAAGGAVDENGLVGGIEGEAKGGEVFVGVAGGVANEVELVAGDVEGLCRELLAAVAGVAVGGDAEVDDGFEVGGFGEIGERLGGEFATAIDLAGDDFGKALWGEIGADGFPEEEGEEEAECSENKGFCERAGGAGLGGNGMQERDATPP